MSPTAKLVLFVVGSMMLMAAWLWWIMSRRAAEAQRSAGPGKPHPMPDNIGAASKEEIEAYAAYVLEALGYDRFDMCWTTAGSAWIRPHVYIDEKYIGAIRWLAKEMVLHEITHISTHPADRVHGRIFYNRYVTLLSRFMCQERARFIPEQPTPYFRKLGARSVPERPARTRDIRPRTQDGRRWHGD